MHDRLIIGVAAHGRERLRAGAGQQSGQNFSALALYNSSYFIRTNQKLDKSNLLPPEFLTIS